MHDPMAAFPPEQPDPAPWVTLAAQARELAALADRLATQDPADLAPTDTGNPLADLDRQARELVGAAAACRRAVWQQLVDDGVKQSEIARRWNVDRSRVNQALLRPDRPR